MTTIYTFKTINGETLLGEIYSVSESQTDSIYISYPVKIVMTPVMTKVGFYTEHIPMLYQPFGESPIIPFRKSFFSSIQPCSYADERYYINSLEVLVLEETRRLMFMDSLFNSKEHSDVYIFNSPELIQ